MTASSPNLLPSQWGVVAVFVAVYLGMILGGLPRLKLDRSGVALLGAIAVIGLTGGPLEVAARAVDLPTIALLFSFMVVSAQMQQGGFYGEVVRRVGAWPLSRAGLLAALITVAAALSAVFSNDVICLAMTPMVARLCLRRGLNPLPYLIGLCAAANIGSAATLIGNPQNMLIGSVLRLDFAAYLREAIVPVLISLFWLWWWLAFGPGAKGAHPPSGPRPVPEPLGPQDSTPFERWQSAKGLSVALGLLVVFLFTDWPRDVAALAGAGLLLLSRRRHSAEVLGLVDWPLLVLFVGLFVVNQAFASTGLAAQAVAWAAAAGVHLSEPGPLMGVALLLSNLVSNVPAVMLLLPHLGAPAQEAGVLLALVSTLAGNLLLVGSIANLIVADLAAREGIVLDAWRHALTGVPVTLVSLGVLWVWRMV
jgi:Na+/H+ antiporter NhaD/arsenite permease-like protein